MLGWEKRICKEFSLKNILFPSLSIIHYDGSVEDGCTVDLLTSTNKKNGIKFKVGMDYENGCLTNSSIDNL